MSTRGFSIVMFATILVLFAACAPAAPVPTPTVMPKATVSPPPSKAEATPVAKTSPAPVAKEAAKPSALEQLIEGARKDGAVRAALTGDLGEKGAQRLADAFNKKYGLNLKVDITLVSSMREATSKMVMELKTGAEPSWDVIHAFVGALAPMVDDGVLAKYDWVGTFPYISPKAVLLDGALLFINSTVKAPAYNFNLVRPGDLPRRWEDFHDPKWTGNLVHHDTGGVWAEFVEVWGEERTTAFVEGIARQNPVFARAYQVVPQIASGEYSMTPHIMGSAILKAMEKGAPVRAVEGIAPLPTSTFMLAIPKTAKYPNAAKLFTGFQLTLEAQQIWWDEDKTGSPFVAGPMAEWVKGKDVFWKSLDFELKRWPSLQQKYDKILGLK
ncbi:MAG: extracellular solute-binding protein [Chloroflexi bacterium]|nr:extracellular solute-binding protein [Chloroflexota bacterium]